MGRFRTTSETFEIIENLPEWLLYVFDKPEDIILNKIFNIYIVSPNINRNNYKNYSFEKLARSIQHCRMRLKDLEEAEKLIKQLEEIKHYNY